MRWGRGVTVGCWGTQRHHWVTMGHWRSLGDMGTPLGDMGTPPGDMGTLEVTG